MTDPLPPPSPPPAPQDPSAHAAAGPPASAPPASSPAAASRWATQPEPGASAVLDTRSLRAMAHPVRLRMIGLLRAGGPSTATRLAEQLGLNSGATSYHLRQLAGAGFVAEEPGLGTGRDRWWRAVHRNTWLRADQLDPADRGAATAYLHAVASNYADRLQQAVADLDALRPAWQDAWDLSDYRMRLTPTELTELLAEIGELINRRRRDLPAGDPEADPGPPGAASVVLQLQAFALLGPTTTHEPTT